MFPKSLFFVCFLQLLCLCHTTDNTRINNAHGKQIVETVVKILQDKCIISDPIFFLRVAEVATDYGNNRYIAENSGGISKVTENKFNEIRKHLPQLKTHLSVIAHSLNIDWNSVTWSDMSKPLYSCLAAVLYLQCITPDSVPETLEEQATYYNKYYDNLTTAHSFYEKAMKIRQSNCSDAIREITFILDTSQSVTNSDISYLQTFLQNVVAQLPQDSSETQIAIVGYSTNQHVIKSFGSGLDLSHVYNDLDKSRDSHGVADTAGTLKFVNENIFNARNGMPVKSAKSVVLITSDPFLNKSSSIQQAGLLKAKGVRIFVVGIGRTIEKEYLSRIASSPSCSSLLRVSKYSNINVLKEELTQLLCSAPEIVHVGSNVFPCNRVSSLKIPSLPGGLTIKMTVESGDQEVFGSFSSYQPNKDYNDLSAVVTPTHPLVFNVNNKTDLVLKMDDVKSCSGNISLSVNVGVSSRDCNHQNTDVVFLVDSSNDVSAQEFNSMINFVKIYTEMFDIGPLNMQISLVSFGDSIHNHFWLDSYSSSDILQALGNIQRQESGERNIAKALRFVRENSFSLIHGRANSLQEIILITTGPSLNRAETINEAHELIKAGYRLGVVGIGQNAAMQSELSMIIPDQKHLYHVDRADALESIKFDVAKIVCGVVKVLCVEAGIVRNCTTKDVQHAFAKSELPLPNLCSTNLQVAPHPYDTSKYLMCDHSRQLLVVQCPQSEVFCIQTKLCQTKCDITSSTVVPTTPRPTPRLVTSLFTTTAQIACDQDPCTPADIGKYFAGCKENIYIHCGISGTGVYNNCPIDKIWNQAIITCVNKYVVSETGTLIKSFPNPCYHQVGDVYFPFPYDSSKFIHCDGYGDGFVGSCPDNSIWNQSENKCNDVHSTSDYTLQQTSDNTVKTTSDNPVKSTTFNIQRPTLA